MTQVLFNGYSFLSFIFKLSFLPALIIKFTMFRQRIRFFSNFV